MVRYYANCIGRGQEEFWKYFFGSFVYNPASWPRWRETGQDRPQSPSIGRVADKVASRFRPSASSRSGAGEPTRGSSSGRLKGLRLDPTNRFPAVRATPCDQHRHNMMNLLSRCLEREATTFEVKLLDQHRKVLSASGGPLGATGGSPPYLNERARTCGRYLIPSPPTTDIPLNEQSYGATDWPVRPACGATSNTRPPR